MNRKFYKNVTNFLLVASYQKDINLILMPLRIIILSLFITLITHSTHAQKETAKLTRSQKKAEIARIQAELKPLREKARETQSVKEVRKKLDNVMTEYYRTLRNEMLRIDPSKKELIEREAALQKELRSKKRQALKE